MIRSTRKAAEDSRFIRNAGELRESQWEGFARALHDEDSFTLFYELAYSDGPVATESLCKTFGADPGYVLSALARLQRLGVVTKKGTRWTAEGWSAAALKALEGALENRQFEILETESEAREVSLENFVASAATYNGLWFASASHVTPLDRESGIISRTSTIENGTAKFGSERPDRGQNETRSHDYK